MYLPLEPLQKRGLPTVSIFQADGEDGHSGGSQQKHRPHGNCEHRAAQRTGHQKAPGPCEQYDQEKAVQRDVGQPRQNADQVVREKGKEKDKDLKDIPLPAYNLQVLVRHPLVDQPLHKPLPQYTGQPEHKDGTARHCQPGHQE